MNAWLWLSLLAVPLCGVLDRIRGGALGGLAASGHRWAWALRKGAVFLYGAVLWLLMWQPGTAWWTLPLFVLGHWAGARPGWGFPAGWAVTGKFPGRPGKPGWDKTPHGPETWQIGPLAARPWLSLVVRGAIWGLPQLGLWLWMPQAVAMIAVMAIAMPAGIAIERWLARGVLLRGTDFELDSEFWRGCVAAGLVVWVATGMVTA